MIQCWSRRSPGFRERTKENDIDPAPVRPERLTGRCIRTYAAGMFIALGFLMIGLLAQSDIGLTWDERETYNAALLDMRMVKAVLTGQPTQSWKEHELPGYYFTLDLLRGAFARVLSTELHLMDEISAFHLANLLLSTLTVFLLYCLAYEVSGKRRIAILSATALGLFPQFVAHSQNNPKDLPAVFTFVLAICMFVRLREPCRFRDVLFAGMALGLALSSSVSAALLFPVLVIWHLLTRTRLRLRRYLILLGVAAPMGFLCWPWLWSAPVANLTWAIKHVAAGLHLSSPLRVLYLGRIYNAWELPWTYSLVMVLATTPVLYLLFAAVSLSRLQIRVEAAKAPARSAAILGWLWVGIFLAAETRAPLRYDGSRHLLMIAPGFCLLVGLGLDSLLGWIEAGRLFQGTTRIRRIVRIACMGAVFGYMGLGLVWIHPYYNAYLNEVTNALLERAEDLFEVEYWGQSYKEGAEWLNLNAEPDADIYVGLNKQIADRYLNRKSRELNEHSLPEFEDPGRVAYFMVITRKAVYRESIEHIVRSFEPVFSIRRQKGTLLHVYTNRRVRTNSVSTSGSTQTH